MGSWFEELFSCFLHYLPFNVLSTLFVGFVPVHKDVILGPRTLRCTKQVRNTLKIFRLGGIVDEVLEALQLQQRVKLGLGLFAPVSKLGEGGYAYVFLAKETAAGDAGPQYALKKVLASSGEALEAARREIAIQSQLNHPNCLPLLDHAITAADSGQQQGSTSMGIQEGEDAAAGSQAVYLLSPAYTDGTLAEELDELQRARAKAGRGPAPGSGGVSSVVPLLPTRQVLHIFQQLCAALEHMHSRGFAHRDVKPHNCLISRPTSSASQQPSHSSPTVSPSQAQVDPESQALLELDPQGSQVSRRGTAGGAASSQGGGCDGNSISSTTSSQYFYRAVLMDFGSARPRMVELRTRSEALSLQEDAEANCTATFRAPELFDAPSPATLDQAAADVWALGCTLYATCYGQSPFQLAINEPGASLALAVMNCSSVVKFPQDPARCYPAAVHDLVLRCIQYDPAARPTATQLREAAESLLGQADLIDPPALMRQ